MVSKPLICGSSAAALVTTGQTELLASPAEPPQAAKANGSIRIACLSLMTTSPFLSDRLQPSATGIRHTTESFQRALKDEIRSNRLS